MTEKPDKKTQVRNWLLEHGYPFEMRVAAVFQKQGFQVLQSDYFVGADGKPHEIDIVASLEKRFKEVRLRVTIIVECKRSKDKPWILLCGNNRIVAPTMRVEIQPASYLGSEFADEYRKDEEFQNNGIYKAGGHYAYGLLQAHSTQGNAPAHEAISSLTRALQYRIEKANLAKGLAGCCELFIPVLATEGEIYECTLESSNDLALENIVAGTLILRRPFLTHPMTMIEVIREEHLKDFAEEMHSASQVMLKKMEKYIHSETPQIEPLKADDMKNTLRRTFTRRQMRSALNERGLLPELAEKKAGKLTIG